MVFYELKDNLELFQDALKKYKRSDYEEDFFEEAANILNQRGYEEDRFADEDEKYFDFEPDLIFKIVTWLKRNTDLFH